MTRRKPLRWVWLAGILMLGSESAAAQQTVGAHVVGAGGGYTTNDRFTLHATFGQQIVGRVGDGALEDHQGFWRAHGARAAAVPAVTDAGATQGSASSVPTVVPNPFSLSTEVRFTLGRSGQVVLTLYDPLGRRVAILADEAREPGEAVVSVDGSDLPSGAYTLVLTGPDLYRAMPLTVTR